MRFIIGHLLLTCLLISGKSSAQALLTVEQAVAAALQNNYEIKLVKNDSVLAALNNSYAYTAFLPTVNAQSALLFNNNNIKQKLADGSERKRNSIHSNNLNASINLNWTIFDGFKMFATKDKLQEILTLGELSVRNRVATTVSDVIKTYYNIVRQKQQVTAIEEQMKLNETRAELAEKRLSVGLGAKPELLQAKVDLNAQKSARLTQLNLIEQLKDQLNLMMAMAKETRYEVADSIPFKNDLIVTDIMMQAETNSPELLMAKQNIEIAKLTLKEAKADRWPILSFNTAYNFNRTVNKEVVNNFSTLLNRNHGFNYGLSATIPLFNRFNVKRQIEVATLDIDYQNTLYEYQRYNINTAISITYKDYELQKKTLALEEENILLAKENVYIATERLRLGITTFVELREAQQSLELAYNRLIAARYNTKVAETELLRLKGDLVN
ncbi:MAG TPA: TolC family protein [Ferruginibacter sp.]|nr:TolC family protein [Ferruginibacter sp.]HRE62937.1 TolC family protein [Ferruginibacter sp.]